MEEVLSDPKNLPWLQLCPTIKKDSEIWWNELFFSAVREMLNFPFPYYLLIFDSKELLHDALQISPLSTTMSWYWRGELWDYYNY